MIYHKFPIIYKGERFLVDPELLYSSSLKFQDIVNNNQKNFENAHLKITFNIFTTRNVCNFLKICQNQQTDVQDSEMKEICFLAKLFEADQIFNTSFNYIQKVIDPNFYIPSDLLKEIDEKQNLIFEPDDNSDVFHCNLNELEFEESSENHNNNEQKRNHSICYQIKIENPFFKCHRFYLINDNKIIYSAKQKYDEIVIGKGQICHLQNSNENVAKITRNFKGYNSVETKNQEFKINYLKFGEKFFVKTSFDHSIGKQNWRPIEKDCPNMLRGEYDHNVVHSRKNVVLQNKRNHPTFILRKVSNKIYEFECHPIADPVVVFAIALSQIIGPIAM